MKTLAIVGSTGSVGHSALKALEKNKHKFKLIFLTAHKNKKKILMQKKKFQPKKIFLTKENKYDFEFFLKNYKNKIDYVISAVSGFEALDTNIKLLKISKNLLLANKETIICGGKIFLNLSHKYKCKILPIDSEHYCLNFLINNLKLKTNISQFYISASGGPFFKKKIKYDQTIESVLNHPTWKMGKKITVDSSNFANKVLELFEANILFNIPVSKLSIFIDPTSRVHSMIKFKNNIYLPVIHKPTMQIPILNSLEMKNNFDISLRNLNFSIISPDKKKFPLIKLGFKILGSYGHNGMIIFTVLNERLVKLFLKKKIMYGDIQSNLINFFKRKIILKYLKKKLNNIEDISEFINIFNNLKI